MTRILIFAPPKVALQILMFAAESFHEKFYKGGSQEETLLLQPEFFLLPGPVNEREV
jgi:hypothetical protein